MTNDRVTYLVFMHNQATKEDFVVPHTAGPGQQHTVQAQLRFRYPPHKFTMLCVYTLEELEDTLEMVRRWPGVATRPQHGVTKAPLPAASTAIPKAPDIRTSSLPTIESLAAALVQDGVTARVEGAGQLLAAMQVPAPVQTPVPAAAQVSTQSFIQASTQADVRTEVQANVQASVQPLLHAAPSPITQPVVKPTIHHTPASQPVAPAPVDVPAATAQQVANVSVIERLKALRNVQS